MKTIQSTDCSFNVREYDGVPYLFIEFSPGEGKLAELEDIRLVPVKGATSQQLEALADQLNEKFMSVEWLE